MVRAHVTLVDDLLNFELEAHWYFLGRLYSCGWNTKGQLGLGVPLQNVTSFQQVELPEGLNFVSPQKLVLVAIMYEVHQDIHNMKNSESSRSGGLVARVVACRAKDLGSIPGLSKCFSLFLFNVVGRKKKK